MILSCHMWLMYFVFLHARMKKILTYAALCVTFKNITLVQLSHSVVSDSLRPHGLQHARPPCPSPTPGVYSNSSPWMVMPSSHLILCHPLLLLPPTLPASESFPMSQLFTWGGQSTGVSALASFLQKKSQGWSPSEWFKQLKELSLQSGGVHGQSTHK